MALSVSKKVGVGFGFIVVLIVLLGGISFLSIQHSMKTHDEVIAHRKKLFDLYKEILKVPVIDGPNNTYWLCTVLVNNREKVAQLLLENGVETNLVHTRNDAYKIFGGKADLPVMDEVEGQYLCLPLHMGGTEENILLISNLVNTYGRT